MTNYTMPALGDEVFQELEDYPEDVTEAIKLMVEDHLQNSADIITSMDPELDEQNLREAALHLVFVTRQLEVNGFWSDPDDIECWLMNAQNVWNWAVGEGS